MSMFTREAVQYYDEPRFIINQPAWSGHHGLSKSTILCAGSRAAAPDPRGRPVRRRASPQHQPPHLIGLTRSIEEEKLLLHDRARPANEKVNFCVQYRRVLSYWIVNRWWAISLVINYCGIILFEFWINNYSFQFEAICTSIILYQNIFPDCDSGGRRLHFQIYIY